MSRLTFPGRECCWNLITFLKWSGVIFRLSLNVITEVGKARASIGSHFLALVRFFLLEKAVLQMQRFCIDFCEFTCMSLVKTSCTHSNPCMKIFFTDNGSTKFCGNCFILLLLFFKITVSYWTKFYPQFTVFKISHFSDINTDFLFHFISSHFISCGFDHTRAILKVCRRSSSGNRRYWFIIWNRFFLW